jgi:hypothetical protein
VIKHDIHATCFIRAYSFNQDITTKLDGSGSLEKIFCGIRRWLVVLSLVTHPFARQASVFFPLHLLAFRHRKIVTFQLARASLALADHIICLTIGTTRSCPRKNKLANLSLASPHHVGHLLLVAASFWRSK